MDSQTLIQQTNSKLEVRVHLWKDSPGAQLSPVLSINNSKAALSQPEWVRKVSVRFDAIPIIFHIELSDSGAYSFIKSSILAGVSSVEVVDTTGWEIGTKIIFRSSTHTDKFTITGITGDEIFFDGVTQNAYSSSTDTVEDDRWYKVATTRLDATATWLSLGETVDDHPMQTSYGQYWRIGPESEQVNSLTDFLLFPDTYYDLTPYLAGPVEIHQAADLKTGESPLATANIRLFNVDDRFGRRNPNSPYIDGTVNYMRRDNRVTVEWIAKGPDWEMAQVAGTPDWRLLGTFTTRQPSLTRGEFAEAVFEGEALPMLKYAVDVPLQESTTVKDLMSDWVLIQWHREALAEGADNAVKHRIAVLETDELSRTNTAFQEVIGRGDFGNCRVFYSDYGEEEPNEDQSPVLYAGFYGIASDGKFLYTCHSMEEPEGTPARGMYIVKRFMSGVPVDTKSIFLFYESDTSDIEEGDIAFVGDIMWVHTAQQNVTNNVFKIDWSDADNPIVTASAAPKGSAGHFPVHATSDGTFLYILYDGGAEGRVLYKVNANTYATIWSFTFTADMNNTLDGYTGSFSGTWTFTNGSPTVTAAADGDAVNELKNGNYITLSDGTQWYRVIGRPNANTITISPAFAQATHTDEADSSFYNKTVFSFGGARSGITLIGDSTLLIFSYRQDTAGDARRRRYIAVRYTLQDSPTYVTEAVPPIDFVTKMNPEDSMNNTYGWASVVQTGAGLLGMTGGGSGVRGQPQKEENPDAMYYSLRGGAIAKIATIRFFAQNGNIINKADEYTDPRAQKDSANYDLEQVWVGNELQTSTGTYSGTTKTTDSYIINLLTGEILFITPPEFGDEVRIDYDFKPSVQFFKADNLPRWQTVRDLAQVANAIAYTTKEGRVSVKLRRGQEDHILDSGSGETIQLRGRNIIHTSNSAYDFNTLQVSNADHNFFYTEGSHYGIVYNAGIYTLSEVGTSLDGHIVITYLQGPSDDALILFDDNGQENPPTMMDAPESWSFAEIVNSVIVEGERSFPLDTPITYLETYAISPQQVNIDSPFSKVQRAEANAQYDWDGDRKIFLTEEKENISGSGFIVEFSDPLIIGTTKWILREPDDSHVEEKLKNQGGGAAFVKVIWDTPFLEPGSAEQTTNYDVLLTNNAYWRVTRKEDEKDAAWPGPGEFYKTGAYVYLKKFRDDDGDGSSDICTAYAYPTKDTSFYIDEAGIIQESEISESTNPSSTASPDKSIYVRIGATDERGAHLWRQAGTYDSVVIPAAYAVTIGAVRIGYDGISVDVNNYASIEHFLQVLVVGYPISGIERVRVKCEDRITLDGSLSSIDQFGDRNRLDRKSLPLDNKFIQSVSLARTVGYGLLDWLKYEHSYVPVRDKFNDRLNILEPCLVRAAYGSFDETTELWLVSEIRYSLVKGDSGMSSTTYLLVDMEESPSAPPAGSS